MANRSRIARRLAEIVWEIERLKQTVRAKYLDVRSVRPAGVFAERGEAKEQKKC